MDTIEIISATSEVYDNVPGYETDIYLVVKYDDLDYNLTYQPQDPLYLSGDFIARESDGYSTGAFSLSNATGDDSQLLFDAIVEKTECTEEEAIKQVDAATQATRQPFEDQAMALAKFNYESLQNDED